MSTKEIILEPGALRRRPKAYRICPRCVMDTSDENIEFDDTGVCSHCHNYDRAVLRYVRDGGQGVTALQAIVDQIKREGAGKQYDCVIGVSGGVDSTFVAWKVKELGLRPVAVHLDNGWNSEIAVSNISSALRELKIDLHTHVIDWEEFKDIQRAFLFASTPDAEVPSDHAIFAILARTAAQFDLKHVITGVNIRTESHLPGSWSQGHGDWGYIRAVHRRFGTGRIKTFPHFGFREFVQGGLTATCQTTDILNYVTYSKKDALRLLQEKLYWRDYGGKHYESVYTRWFQGCYLPRKFGFDKRRCHLSSLICSGEITRAVALERLEQPPYPLALQQQDCDYVAKKLGLTSGQFQAIMSAAPKRFEDYPSFRKTQNSRLYRAARAVYRVLKGRPRTATKA